MLKENVYLLISVLHPDNWQELSSDVQNVWRIQLGVLADYELKRDLIADAQHILHSSKNSWLILNCFLWGYQRWFLYHHCCFKEAYIIRHVGTVGIQFGFLNSYLNYDTNFGREKSSDEEYSKRYGKFRREMVIRYCWNLPFCQSIFCKHQEILQYFKLYTQTITESSVVGSQCCDRLRQLLFTYYYETAFLL